MTFTRDDTSIGKGVAICLMFIHHLFGFSERLLNGNQYLQLLPFYDLEAKLGSFGSICVSIFIFLSGYGLYIGYYKSNLSLFSYTKTKLLNFYATYWLYFFIFVTIGFLFYPGVTIGNSQVLRYSTNIYIFLLNLLGLSSTYNEEWWFVRAYVMMLVFLFPLFAILAKKNIAIVVLISLTLLLINPDVNPYGNRSFIYWQPSLALGIVFANIKFFDDNKFINYFKKNSFLTVILWILIFIELRMQLGGTKLDFLIAPLFVFCAVRLVHYFSCDNIFKVIGKYSFQLWLVHSFFCYYFWQDLVYSPKHSIAVFAFLISLSLLSVLVVEFIRLKFMVIFNKFIPTNSTLLKYNKS